MSARALLLMVPVMTFFGAQGCAERRLHVTSDPAGARVWINDTEVGRTPVEVDFTYFGTYDVRLEADGHEPLWTSAEAEAPIWEWPGFDAVTLLVPTTTRIDWHFELEPTRVDVGALVERAQELRTRVESGGDAAAGEGDGEEGG